MTYLVVAIEEERRKLQELTEHHGTTSPITIECSERLDYLLQLLESMLQKNKTTKES